MTMVVQMAVSVLVLLGGLPHAPPKAATHSFDEAASSSDRLSVQGRIHRLYERVH